MSPVGEEVSVQGLKLRDTQSTSRRRRPFWSLTLLSASVIIAHTKAFTPSLWCSSRQTRGTQESRNRQLTRAAFPKAVTKKVDGDLEEITFNSIGFDEELGDYVEDFDDDDEISRYPGLDDDGNFKPRFKKRPVRRILNEDVNERSIPEEQFQRRRPDFEEDDRPMSRERFQRRRSDFDDDDRPMSREKFQRRRSDFDDDDRSMSREKFQRGRSDFDDDDRPTSRDRFQRRSADFDEDNRQMSRDKYQRRRPDFEEEDRSLPRERFETKRPGFDEDDRPTSGSRFARSSQKEDDDRTDSDTTASSSGQFDYVDEAYSDEDDEYDDPNDWRNPSEREPEKKVDPRSPYQGYWDRRDLRFEPIELDATGELQQLSIDELEERLAEKFQIQGATPRRAPKAPVEEPPKRRREDEDDDEEDFKVVPRRILRASKRIIPDSQRTYMDRSEVADETGERRQPVKDPKTQAPPRPKVTPVAEPTNPGWGQFPPKALGGDTRKVGASEETEEMPLPASTSDAPPADNQLKVALPPAKKDLTKKRDLEDWLMPKETKLKLHSKAAKEEEEDLPEEVDPSKMSRIGGVSVYQKLYRAALRNMSPLPWSRVEGNTSWMDASNQTWKDIGLRGKEFDTMDEILKNFGVFGPNILQEQAIPTILEGPDVLLTSTTGSGKTLAFLLPLLQKYVLPFAYMTKPAKPKVPVHMIPRVLSRPRLLIVLPGRELAIQTHRIIQDLLMPFPNLNCTLLTGQDNHKNQDERLKTRQPLVVVGTPGKILDHSMEGRLVLNDLDAVVLDEVDSLLSVSRQDHVELLMNHLSGAPATQRVLVSASGTATEDALKFAQSILRGNWSLIGPKRSMELPSRVLHIVNGAPDDNKKSLFLKRLATSQPEPNGVLVFCNNHERARKVTEQLRQMDIAADLLTGNRSKEARDLAIRRAQKGEIDFLVATDAAMRGLDFRDLTHVVNYELPGNAATYAHRAGRCGRMGCNGLVISLASGGIKNHRLKGYSDELGFELFEGNVNEGQLGVELDRVHTPMIWGS